MSNELRNRVAEDPKREMELILNSINYSKSNSKFYRNLFAELKINWDDFSLNDFRGLPFTTKQDISENNLEFLAVGIDKVADFSTTSGTSGAPITIFSTKTDLEILADNEAYSFGLVGANSNDVFQLMTSMDKQFMAGLAYYLGAQKLNSGIIRIGPGVPSLQWKSVLLYRPTILIGVPSFVVALMEFARANNIDYSKCSVKKIICIGEPIRDDNFQLNIIGKRITQDWNVELFSTYASTEMSVAFTECEMHLGNHLNDDLLFLEVLDENGIESEEGEVGEVVITTLKREGMPLIRYRTGDLTRIYREPCKCGRNTPRIGRIIGRLNQMIKFKGTTIFPGAIFDVLDNLPRVWLYKVEVEKDNLENDKIIIYLQQEIQNTTDFEILVEACKSRLRVLPVFVFESQDFIYNMIYKKDIRKPEKISFK